MVPHHERNMGNKAVPIFQQAVNEDPKLLIDSWAQITVTMYATHNAIV
jgi:hypothetical protein